MRVFTICTATVLASCLALGAAAQSNQGRQKTEPAKKTESVDKPAPASETTQQDTEAIKLDTTLVTVPVIASDRNGLYIPDMKRNEFTVHEDGVRQEIVFFATIDDPFQVVLMLDTSASTKEKLAEIQRAAGAFLDELHAADRVMVISFDDDIRVQCDFTGDRADLRSAIAKTRPGQGTRLYDAVRLALAELKSVRGRKALVIFTDGVEWRSNRTRYEDNIREIEESNVIAYPIRYDTREETERLARRQQEGGGVVTPDIVFGPPRTTTPPTVPGGGGPPTTEKKDPYELPLPPIWIPRRTDPRRYPDDRYPGGRDPRDRLPEPPPSGPPNEPGTPRRGRRDDISVMLDNAYRIADEYLNDLAEKSGGKLHRADTLLSLPAAFAQIAGELRTQYSLGYYPSNTKRDGSYRRIEVRTTRKEVVIRARPGYRAAVGAGN
ncbi:MAG TPA: VWA domain-containing protein [Blastocatellia bacterium]|nr:VWA domain-containing protein [Blastocatellia bacterium]